jgi:LacI family transcriptional regulator
MLFPIYNDDSVDVIVDANADDKIYPPRTAIMHVTLKDVAQRAGVSAKTVSRVVNNQGEISEQTRVRVQSAIQELGYRPNILARSLVHQRSNTLAVVASGIEYFGPSRTLLGVEQQANAFGYSLFLNLVHDPQEPRVLSLLDELVARRVDGIVWAVPEIGSNRDWIAAARLANVPPIVFLSMAPRPNLSIVAVDNRAGAQLATQHLYAQGRRRIGIITGPLNWWEARERLAGWKTTLTTLGLKPDKALIAEGNWSPASGERAMEQLLGAAPKLDAVFCSNDQMALGALGVLHRAGRRVPEDIAIVGFDNIPESEFFLPPLSTVYQQVIDIGRIAVQELHERIQAEREPRNGKMPEMTQLTPTLIRRASS